VFAQQKWDVEVHFYASMQKNEKIFPDERFQIDSLQIDTLIGRRLKDLYALGYLKANYNIEQQDSLKYNVNFYSGDIFNTIAISSGNVSEGILNKISYRPDHFRDKAFSYQRIVKIFDEILKYSESNGFPFASVKLDSITFQQNGLSAILNYSSGPKIVFDSLIVSGFDNVSEKYLMAHLGIYSGKAYDERLVREIRQKIGLLSFIRLTEEPLVVIRDGVCNIHIEIEPLKVSQVDGIIGLLPNQRNGEQLLITGQALLDLRNLFSSGKTLTFQWQSFDAKSQLLDVLYYHPNIFKTPVNVEGACNLLKQDTTFLTRSARLELSFLARNSSQIGFGIDVFNSRLISSAGLESITQIPQNNDFNLNYYYLNYRLKRFDDVISPRSGWGLRVAASAGQKKIIKNPAIDEEVYAGIDLNSIQYKLDAEIDKYWKISPILGSRTRWLAGYLSSDNLFESDLYRIGGLRSLRGFAEKEIFASAFTILNLELRAYLSSDTYFLVFFDQAVYTSQLVKDDEINYPFGSGLGLTFDTNAGTLNFVFAMGKSSTQPFAVNNSKIHFGYIARF
jgi:outer membrane protein assembly factor BamA